MRIINILKEDEIVKLVFELDDGLLIENCYLPGKFVCLSSQAGCLLNCKFCYTGKCGFARNLTSEELIKQIELTYELSPIPRFETLSFSGMGEPLLNLDNVILAMKYIKENYDCCIAISTTGIVDKFDTLFGCGIDFALDLSLHASSDAVRNKLMPINKKYGVARVIDEVFKWVSTRNMPWFFVDYMLLKGVNDSEEDLQCLIELLKGRNAVVELKYYNVKGEDGMFEPSDEMKLKHFRHMLLKNGIGVHLEKSKGQNIGAGCGQMVWESRKDKID